MFCHVSESEEDSPGGEKRPCFVPEENNPAGECGRVECVSRVCVLCRFPAPVTLLVSINWTRSDRPTAMTEPV